MSDQAVVDDLMERASFLASGGDELHARRMFGGFGIYRGAAMFGIVAYGKVWLKTDEENLGDFESGGAEQFAPEMKNGKRAKMSFFTVPASAGDSPAGWRPWIESAAAAAERALAKRRQR